MKKLVTRISTLLVASVLLTAANDRFLVSAAPSASARSRQENRPI
jgi:hypothetical protein